MRYQIALRHSAAVCKFHVIMFALCRLVQTLLLSVSMLTACHAQMLCHVTFGRAGRPGRIVARVKLCALKLLSLCACSALCTCRAFCSHMSNLTVVTSLLNNSVTSD